ncbi:uncharacterized protein LOC124132632 isoform X2 [Haliotis rufescens]|uniref:uncharacterized protein LOC124132632 isoform X2 n=1 Tax=Haliotis rufescens TaxID=6454 RepID=UPI00201E92A2|nr:uncharacterized protein LOC124132632 isoform X2 [Haliotis rufescens]
MLLLLVTLSCLAAVKAQGVPCCMEPQWSATMFNVRALSKGNSVSADFYYDFTNKATAIQYYQYGATQRVKANRVVTSYEKNEQYNIDADGTCTKNVPTDVLLPNCIPDDSTDLGSSYIGTEASGLKSDTWLITIGSVNLTVGVTSANCVLTFQGIAYTGGYPPDTEAYFNGYKVGITDPAAFDIPLSC